MEKGGAALRAAVGGFMVLSLLSKPMYVTLPLLLLLLDVWPLNRRLSWKLVIEKAPLAALALASSIITIAVQATGGAVVSAAALPLRERAANALVAYASYLKLAVWPAALSFHYPHPGMPGVPPLSAGAVLGAAAVLAAVSVMAWRSRLRMLVAGWLFYLVTLLPVIGVIQVGVQGMADRYTYLALAGPFIMAVYGIADAASRWRARLPALKPAAACIAVLVLAAFAVRAFDQVGAWRSSRTLLDSAAAAVPENPLVLNNLAWLLATHPDETARDPERAVDLAAAAVRATAGGAFDYVDTLAAAYAAAGRFDLAIETAAQAARVCRLAGAGDIAAEVERRAALFRQKRPFIDDTFCRLERRRATRASSKRPHCASTRPSKIRRELSGSFGY